METSPRKSGRSVSFISPGPPINHRYIIIYGGMYKIALIVTTCCYCILFLPSVYGSKYKYVCSYPLLTLLTFLKSCSNIKYHLTTGCINWQCLSCISWLILHRIFSCRFFVIFINCHCVIKILHSK